MSKTLQPSVPVTRSAMMSDQLETTSMRGLVLVASVWRRQDRPGRYQRCPGRGDCV